MALTQKCVVILQRYLADTMSAIRGKCYQLSIGADYEKSLITELVVCPVGSVKVSRTGIDQVTFGRRGR